MANTIINETLSDDQKEYSAFKQKDFNRALDTLNTTFNKLFDKKYFEEVQQCRDIIRKVLLENCKATGLKNTDLLCIKVLEYDPDAKTFYKLSKQEYDYLYAFANNTHMFGVGNGDFPFNNYGDVVSLIDTLCKHGANIKYESKGEN